MIKKVVFVTLNDLGSSTICSVLWGRVHTTNYAVGAAADVGCESVLIKCVVGFHAVYGTVLQLSINMMLQPFQTSVTGRVQHAQQKLCVCVCLCLCVCEYCVHAWVCVCVCVCVFVCVCVYCVLTGCVYVCVCLNNYFSPSCTQSKLAHSWQLLLQKKMLGNLLPAQTNRLYTLCMHCSLEKSFAFFFAPSPFFWFLFLGSDGAFVCDCASAWKLKVVCISKKYGDQISATFWTQVSTAGG